MVEDGLVERRLVKRMLAGEERAFDTFFDSYFPPLFRFAFSRLGGDEEVVEEVTQCTLCAAIDNLSSWRGEAQLFTWLCAICRRQIALHFRKLKRAPQQVELTEDLPEVRAALDSLRADSEDPEQQTARSELRNLIHVALDRLPVHYGQALEWKYLEGISVKEIAVRMKSTPKAVESMLTRARNAYRDALLVLMGGVNPPVVRSDFNV
ncbi:MAG: sigma-70 family RNA polymerase sigma factor [bacterium]|nr:sigma-70 family RNA polymerase sigma factor [bacterium]